MGAGRKTETYNLATPTQQQPNPHPGNRSIPARNLRKDQLGGVIFGCKHSTINECLSKQLFGLPSGHFSYVKNVKPGLPLFLFNYSDRKMHGIFEAACSGQFAIDHYAWSGDGTTKTQFPAQVRVCTKTQCLPIRENQFKSVIRDNYFHLGHFYFELDHGQTRALISLFKPAPVPASFKEVPAVPSTTLKSKAKEGENPNFLGLPSHDSMLVSSNNERTGTLNIGEVENESLSRNSPGGHGQQHDRMTTVQKLRELSVLQQEEAQSSKDASSSAVDQFIPQQGELSATLPKVPFKVTLEDDAHVKENKSFERCHGNAELLQTINELSKKAEAMEKKQIESDQEIRFLRELVNNTERKVQQLEYQIEELQLKYNSSASLLDGTCDHVERPSIFLVGGYNGSNWLSSLDSFSPTTDRLVPLKPMSSARSYAAVAALKDHIYVFGGGNGGSWYHTVECYNWRSDEWITCPHLNHERGSLAGATVNDKIFAVGGGDGFGAFSEVEMFDPVLGRWIYSLSMHQRRFGPAAAELNGVLYAVGGYDGSTYLKSAERYDPREGCWAWLPTMTTSRGCHSVAVLGEALYAVGGYDGDSMLSSVEIFDPRANSWRIGSPISVARGYACAVTLNDNLFLIGGIQSQSCGQIAETVEVYNEDLGWSVPGFKAIGKRCFASAIVI